MAITFDNKPQSWSGSKGDFTFTAAELEVGGEIVVRIKGPASISAILPTFPSQAVALAKTELALDCFQAAYDGYLAGTAPTLP